ncbi:hypothetical protein CK203_043864 [Vitis vinifera]|uniref:MULE transposase domain-containing protein n=1 Tax=Vitis vinifera TaxID=29760 RepID=A0A438HVI3_VITVI|nr:hypothetical protein CK203_043864 [Vitis vinifera]
MDLENSIYGYLHEGGEIVPKEDKQIQYKGGQQKGMYIGQGMSYADFVSKACEWLDINSNGYTFHYTLEFDPSTLQQLDDDEDMHMMLSHSYDYGCIYVLKRTRRVEVEGGIVNVQNDYCHNSMEETHNSVASCQANNESNLGLSQGFMSRCAETEVRPHDLKLSVQANLQCGEGEVLGHRASNKGNPSVFALSNLQRLQRLVDINPRTIAECTRQDGHFWQLFIAHSFSIQGFLMGFRPVIAIDSTHLSGPYRGSLFSATAYDADDGMFPIAFGVVSSENYEDWLWFLQKLKGILQDKEVAYILHLNLHAQNDHLEGLDTVK